MISLIVVLGGAIYLLLPRPQVREAEPVVVRMKIPPISTPEPAQPTEEEQRSLPVVDPSPSLQQGDTSPSAPAAQTHQTTASTNRVDRSAKSDAPAEPSLDGPHAAPLAAADDANPPPLPAAASDKTPADPVAESHPSIDNAQTEATPPDSDSPTPVSAHPEVTTPSDPALASVGNEKEADKDVASEPESSRPKENDAPPAESAEEQKPFAVQVGVFHGRENADNMASELTALGYSSFIHEAQDKRLRPLYKVCFGRFESRGKAYQAAAAFREDENKPALVVRLESR